MSEDRIAQLKKLIAARDGKPGWSNNVAFLKHQLTQLEVEAAKASTAEETAGLDTAG